MAGVAGNITFYKNMADTTLFNRTTGAGSAAGLDIYDTIDDYNNNGAFPTQNPTGWDQATGANWEMDSANDGVGGTVNGDCDGTEACVFKDQMTNLMWTKDRGAFTWENAISECENLSYGGYTDWRLPTQKELLQAYTDGIWSQKATNKLSLIANFYWSSTTSSVTTRAWPVGLNDAYTDDLTKNNSLNVACVR